MYACIKPTKISMHNINKQNAKIKKEYQKKNLNVKIKTLKNIWIKICPDNIFANKRIPKLKGLIKKDIISIINKKLAKKIFILFCKNFLYIFSLKFIIKFIK